MLSYFFFTSLFLLVSIALTITNTFSVYLFDFRVGRINPGTFGVMFTFRCSGNSGSLMLLFCFISDSTSTAQSSLLSFGLSKSPFQLSQSLISEMLSGGLSSSLLTGWRLIFRIRRTFMIWVCPPGRSLHTKVVAKQIFLTIWMQPHCHVERVTRMLWQSPRCLKCIPRQSAAYFEREIPSVLHVGFGCPVTSPKSCEPWPFCVVSLPLPLSSFPSHFLSSCYSIRSQCLPKSRYWLEWTTLQWLFREIYRLWFLTASSR